MDLQVQKGFVRTILNISLSKARCVKNIRGSYPNNHSGFAFKYHKDLSGLLENTCLEAAKKEDNIIPVFINYNKQCYTPFEAINQKIGEKYGKNVSDMNSLLGHLQLDQQSVLLGASGLSNIYQNEIAGQIWAQLHPLLSGYYNAVILTDTHPDFLKLIEAERDWRYIKEKYGKVLPDLNDTKISHIDLDRNSKSWADE